MNPTTSAKTYRIIYTDGRPHPKDLDSNYWEIPLAIGREIRWSWM